MILPFLQSVSFACLYILLPVSIIKYFHLVIESEASVLVILRLLSVEKLKMSCEFGFRGLEMYSEACLLLGTCVPCQQSVTITSPHIVFSEVLTLDHHFDRPSCSSLCSLKCLQGLLKLEPERQISTEMLPCND